MGPTSSRAPTLAEQARRPCRAGALAEGLQGLGELRLGAAGWLSPSGQAAPRSACSHLGHSSQKAHVRRGLWGQEPWAQEASGGGPAGSGLALSHVHPHLPLPVLGGERGQFQKERLGVGGGHGSGSRGDNKQTSRVVGHRPTPLPPALLFLALVQEQRGRVLRKWRPAEVAPYHSSAKHRPPSPGSSDQPLPQAARQAHPTSAQTPTSCHLLLSGV